MRKGEISKNTLGKSKLNIKVTEVWDKELEGMKRKAWKEG